jgi:hypothetical protein
MLDNVKRWIPRSQEPLVQIRVGIGFHASLPVKVNKFVPIDNVLLEQAGRALRTERQHYITYRSR